MQAVTFNAPHAIKLRHVADPELQEGSDAIVRVKLAGICGSDLHPYRGHEVGLDSDTVMGHEFIGEVAAVGQDVNTLTVGDAVVAPFSTSCGECDFCIARLTARCENGQLFGWVEKGYGLHGGQAEFVRVPLADTTLVRIPPALELSPAALFAGDILSTGLFAASLGEIGPGKTVAIVGCGPVGLMCALAAQELGASQVWGIDPLAERLAVAATFGAVPLGAGEQAHRDLLRATDSKGADVVLEAVGTADATGAAYDLVKTGGVIVAAGVHNEPVFGIGPGELYDKNLTYRAGRSSARVFIEPALRIAERRRSGLEAIVTHTLPLEDAVAAYDLFDKRRDGATKVVLTP